MSLHRLSDALVARSATYTKAQQQCLGRALQCCVAAMAADLAATTQAIETLQAIADARYYDVLWGYTHHQRGGLHVTRIAALGNADAARIALSSASPRRFIYAVTESAS